MYYVDYIQFNIQMDITYSWCIICLINLLLNGKFGQAQEDNYTEDYTTDPISFDNTTVTSTTTEFTNKPKVENSTTDGTTYTTTPSYFSKFYYSVLSIILSYV
ncbi:unnamed protein product [Schistosoma rodhaini]|uniref:Uncharacterized protein n=1 Tax=Schistosoma rodhaini TaxID=6188 RepID=A0AA85GC00_9TREM|nr:unnamed protein product [Schistosoma rodhaini]